MRATKAVWKLAAWAVRRIKNELREPGTYRPCPVDLSPGTVWYYVDWVNTRTLPYAFGALVIVSLGPGAIAFDIWVDHVLWNLFRDYILTMDQVPQLQQSF